MDRIGLFHQLAVRLRLLSESMIHREMMIERWLLLLTTTTFPPYLFSLFTTAHDYHPFQPYTHSLSLQTLPAHPESVPINALVAVKGTPFQDHEAPTGLDIARCVATARILMPKTVVRLSAGRMNFSFADQALCFLAGANSIFDGDKLLTTPNNDRNEDLEMFDMLGLKSRPAFLPYDSGQQSSKEEFAASGGGDSGGADGGRKETMTA